MVVQFAPRILLIGVMVIAVVFALTVISSHEPYDDACISFRFARNWAEGNGYSWNPDDPPVYGASSALHCGLLALGARLGAAPENTSRLIQAVSHATLVLLVYLLVVRLGGQWAALGAATLTSISVPTVFQGLGLEMELYTALSLGALLLAIRAHFAFAGLVAGLAAVTRLDGAVVLLSVCSAAALLPSRRRNLLKTLLGAAGPLLIWLFWAVYTFGNPLPQSMIAKLQHTHPGPFAVYDLFDYWLGQPVIAYCLPFAVVGIGGSLTAPERIVSLWVFLYLAAYKVSAMPSYGWYYPPPMIGLYVLAFLGVACLWRYVRIQSATGAAGPSPPDRALARAAPAMAGISPDPPVKPLPGMWIHAGLVSAVALLLLFAVRGATSMVRAAHAQGKTPSAHTRAAEWLQHHAAPGDHVLAFEIGKIGYFTNLHVIDMFGLVSPEQLPALRRGGWTEVIRSADFDYAFIRTQTNPLPAEQQFETVWQDDSAEYQIVTRAD